MTVENPILKKSEHFDQALCFEKIQVSDILPAWEEGAKESLKKIEAIENNPEPPSFENVIFPMEVAYEKMNKASTIFGYLMSTSHSEAIEAIAPEISRKHSEFHLQNYFRPKLFQKIKTVFEKSKDLTIEQKQYFRSTMIPLSELGLC